MWKAACVSVRGSAHEAKGLPCQDASTALAVGSGGETFVLAVSDGAGTARHAEVGSRLLVDGAVAIFTRLLADHPQPEEQVREWDRQDGMEFVKELRGLVEDAAEARGAVVHEFAATLLVAVVHPAASLFFQVGDGCWVASRFGVLGAVTWPAQGEFVGQTMFVTSGEASEHFQLEKMEGRPDFVAGLSDGLERLALDMSGRVPGLGFFLPLVRQRLAAADAAGFEEGLCGFLNSEKVCARTDDDKSLVLLVHAEGP